MVIVLVIGGAIGFVCYKEAEKFQRQYSRGPWSASPMLWGLVGFFFGLFGALFLLIAERNTKKQLQQNFVWTQPAYVQTQHYAPQPYAQATAPPAGQWGPPPAQWAPPPPPAPGPPGPPGPPAPNIGGSDFLPGRH